MMQLDPVGCLLCVLIALVAKSMPSLPGNRLTFRYAMPLGKEFSGQSFGFRIGIVLVLGRGSFEGRSNFLWRVSRETTIDMLLRISNEGSAASSGILEATNLNCEEFGDKRLAELLQKTAELPHSQTADRIIATIKQWEVSQSDDLSVIVCGYS